MGSGAAKGRGKKAAAKQKQGKAASSPWGISSASTPQGKKGKYLSQSPKVNLLQEQQSIRQWQSFAMNSPGDSYGSSPKRFTLADEARNTEHHGNGWKSNVKLRDQGISFVSAGVLNQQQQKPEDGADEDRSEIAQGAVRNSDAPPDKQPHVEDVHETKEVFVQSTITEQVQALNLAGDETEKRPPISPRERSRSPSTSSNVTSEDDVVVFTGRIGPSKSNTASLSTSREASQQKKLPQSHSQRPTLSTQDSGVSATSSGVRHSSRPFELFPVHSTVDRLFAQSVLGTSSSEDIIADTRTAKVSKPKMKPERMSYADLMAEEQISDEDDALVQDYIANMKDLTDSEDELPATDNGKTTITRDEVTQQSIKVTSKLANDNKDEGQDQDNDGWDSADLQDLEDMSTSDECPEKIGRILSSRERASGLQYLVVGIDQPVDDARWITQEVLNSQDAIDVLRAFEARQEAMLAECDSEMNDGDDSSEDDEEAAFNDYLDNLESEQEEADNIRDLQEGMTDEQIAAALAKQEELGMDADEVLLFGGMIDDNVLEGFGSSRMAGKRASPRSKTKSGRRDHFPSAEAFADALDQDPYGAFDIMDFDRPSLKPKKKGRKSGLPFELEDEELQMQLEQSWDNDRRRKAEKKREREALRAQGLLGSKNGKVDLTMKYRNGMSTSNVRYEVKNFLKSSQESLSLTAMDSFQRRQVHVIAHALKLKSKSQGSGAARYPVLSKTRFTPIYNVDYSESELDEILTSGNNPSQLYLAAYKGGKGAFAKVKTTGGATKKRKGGGGANAVGYMEGEIVGAHAPEIGTENRGRAMLEKMGWTAGMGLGVPTNKGIIVPVQHVVKNTKAGLG